MALHIQSIMKNQPVLYYLNQAGRVSPNGDRPYLCCAAIHSTRTWNRQFLNILYRLVLPALWRGVKAVGRVSLRTGGKILSDIADIDRKSREIIAEHVGESAQNLIQKLRGRNRKLPAPYGDYQLKR
jgi:hypothetical protein